MRFPWVLAVANQVVSALVQLAARGFAERHLAASERELSAADAGPRAPARENTVKLVAFLAACTLLGALAVAWLGALAWWLGTGRGPGARLLAAGAVTPRAYTSSAARSRGRRAA